MVTLRCERLGGDGVGVCFLEAPADSGSSGGDGSSGSDSGGGGFVFLVPRALPGELLRARVGAVEARYASATRLATLRPHARAVAPPCPHFERCGGCPLMALDYGAQLEAKRAHVAQLLARVGRVEAAGARVRATVGAPEARRLAFRNKLQFTWGSRVLDEEAAAAADADAAAGGAGGEAGGGAGGAAIAIREGGLGLGFLLPGTRDVVLPISRCLLQGAAANAALAAARDAARELGLEAADAPSGHGVLRHCVIRSAGEGTDTQIQVTIVTTAGCASEQLRPLADALRARVPEVVSIVHSIAADDDRRQAGSRSGGGRGRGGRRQQQRRQRRGGGSGADSSASTGADTDGDGGGGGGERGGARPLRVARSTALFGPLPLRQRLCGLDFQVAPHSFFQTNTHMAEVLYDAVADAVGALPEGRGGVLDLYTGTGTIGGRAQGRKEGRASVYCWVH